MEKRLLKIRSLSEETEDVSFAFGTAFCEDHHDISRAIRSADERMYKDKEAYYLNHPEKDRRARKRIWKHIETATFASVLQGVAVLKYCLTLHLLNLKKVKKIN